MSLNPGQLSEAHSQTGNPAGRVSVLAQQACPPNDDQLSDECPRPRAEQDSTRGLPLPAFASVRIGARTFPFTTLEHVSRAYLATIERMDTGARDTPSCELLDASGQIIGYVSYNGRVWRGPSYVANAVPLFDPYAARAAQ